MSLCHHVSDCQGLLPVIRTTRGVSVSGECPSAGLRCACPCAWAPPATAPMCPRECRRQMTPAGATARDALAPARGPKARAGPARLGPHPAPAYLAAVVIVQVRQAGGLGPGPRAHRGRRGVQADVHGGRGGGGGSRGQCLGGRRVGVSVRAGLRALGAGRGRRPAERPAPTPPRPPRYCSGLRRRRGPAARAQSGRSLLGAGPPPGPQRGPLPLGVLEGCTPVQATVSRPVFRYLE